MSTLYQAVRSLLARPLFTAVAVLTLGLGTGACLAIWSIVGAVLLRPLPYPHPERLSMLWESNPAKGQDAFPASPANFVDWRDQNRVFGALAAFSPDTAGLSGRGEPRRVHLAYVSGDFFPLLGVRPAMGRAFTRE